MELIESLDQVGVQNRGQAVDVLLEEHRPYLLNLLYQLSSDRELAAGLTQEVHLRAWKSFGTFRAKAGLKTCFTCCLVEDRDEPTQLKESGKRSNGQ